MAKPTILIIDDDLEVVHLYTEMFANRGWHVLHAADGDDGVEQALFSLPQAIILDLMLPKKGGLHVLKIFKSLPETKHIPVVITTAYPNPEYKEEAASSGCDHYFLKTEISHPQLADFVDELVKGAK